MENTKKIKRLFILSSFVIFILSTLLHFSYKWSNENPFVGFFAPINESIFQHIKMFVFPTIIYYLITYLLFYKKYEIEFKKYFSSILLTIIVTSVSILFFYYVFKHALSISSMIIDISSFIIGLFISSFLSYKMYIKSKMNNFYFLINLSFSIYVVAMIYYLNYNPIHVDLFLDHETNTYN